MLKFIGSGSAFNTEFGNNSAFYKSGSSILIIDCGGSIFSRIRKSNLLQNINNIYVLITHPHPDHIGSLGDLVFFAYYLLNTKVTVLSPDAENIAALFAYMGGKPDIYNLIKLDDKYEIVDKALKIAIKPYIANHSDSLNCYGYKLVLDGQRIYYSGDSKDISGEVLQLLEDGEIERLYQDTCSYDFDSNPHMSLEKLTNKIKPELRNKVYCMHMDENFDREKAVQLGFNVVTNEFE